MLRSSSGKKREEEEEAPVSGNEFPRSKYQNPPLKCAQISNDLSNDLLVAILNEMIPDQSWETVMIR